MATWLATTFCTVADVRRRLTSPEIVLQLTKANGNRISFVAATTTNTITTGVPHLLTMWAPVSFETTGTLPSPLAINTVYYAIVLDNATIKVASAIGGTEINLTTAGSGTNTVYDASVDVKIQEKITLSKDWLYQALQLDMQSRVPQLVDTWLAYKRWQTENLSLGMMRDLQLLNRIASLPNVGGWFYDGSSFDLYLLLSLTLNLVPRTFSTMGTPTNGASGTYVGQANNGDMLIDGLNQRLYVNRSTSSTSVQWVAPTVDLVLDNILNPTALLHVAVDYALWAMAQDGMFRNRPAYDDATAAGFMVDTESLWSKRAKQRLKEVTPLLKLDLDGDGAVSNFELSMVIAEPAAFA